MSMVPKAPPVLSAIALVFAFGVPFFPRFLIALPVLIAVGLAVGSSFRKERWKALPIIAIVAGLGMLLVVSFPHNPPPN